MAENARARPVLLAIPIVFLGIVLALKPERPEKHWSRPMDVKLGFRVVDDESSAPIGGATLQLIDPYERRLKPARTDDQGFADSEGGFEAEGLETPQGKTGWISFEGWLLRVAAEGYVPALAPLSDTVSGGIDFQAPPPRRKTVRLLKAGSERAKSVPVPGWFTRHDGPNRVSFFLYGDRFYSILDGTLHEPCFEAEGGRARAKDGVLKLTVERVKKYPRPAGADGGWHLDNLSQVTWGGRLYLVAEAQWMAFCNAINQGKEPRSDEYGDFFLRNGDEKKAVTGLPSVPESWDRYLLKEPIRAVVVKVLPFGGTRINIGSASGLKKGMELVPSREFLFSDQVVDSVEENSAVIRTEYPQGRYRKIKVGDIVVSRRSDAG